MKLGSVESWKVCLPLLLLLAVPHGLAAQQDKVAALKQKDLGQDTPKEAPTVTVFDPDTTWAAVKEPS